VHKIDWHNTLGDWAIGESDFHVRLENSPVPFHHWWTIATTVKHFKQED
jgi:hypothetical protein